MKSFRVLVTALTLCVTAFVAGVVGDLSMAASPQTSGQRVTLVIPPDTPRAHPLPPLPHTEAAIARPARLLRRERVLLPRFKPHAEPVQTATKIDLDLAPKGDDVKGA